MLKDDEAEEDEANSTLSDDASSCSFSFFLFQMCILPLQRSHLHLSQAFVHGTHVASPFRLALGKEKVPLFLNLDHADGIGVGDVENILHLNGEPLLVLLLLYRTLPFTLLQPSPAIMQSKTLGFYIV